MLKLADFKKELAECGIKWHYFLCRIELNPSDILSEYPEEYENVSDTLNEEALSYYRDFFERNPRIENWFIQEWAKEDTRAGQAVKFALEERTAIQSEKSIA